MRHNGTGISAMGVAALFMAGFFLLVIFGARTYQDAAALQSGHNERRALLSYLSVCVKGSDTTGGVQLREEDGPLLVLADGSGYGLFIYQRDGKLMEEYSAVDAQPDPRNASVLGETDVFSVEEVRPGTLRIETDAGKTLLKLRSAEAEP